MLLSKFKIILTLLLSVSMHGHAKLSAKECLQSDFSVAIEREGLFFGLIPYELKITKNRCQVEINYQRFYPITWELDICREPLHIKRTDFRGLSIIKKTGDCRGRDNQFCKEWNNILSVMQDEALILSDGERDVLTSDHGKIFCLYHLLLTYVNNDHIFSMSEEKVIDIFTSAVDDEPESCAKPESVKESPQPVQVPSVQLDETSVEDKTDNPMFEVDDEENVVF